MALLERKKQRNGGLPSLRSNLDELFDFGHLFDEPNWNLPMSGRKTQQVPATNIQELDKEYLLELAAPGLKKDDFKLDVDENMLEIQVEHEEEKSESEDSFTRREFNYTSFYRSFRLPENILHDKIKAEYKEGLLRVHLPKKKPDEKKKSQRISIS